MPKVKANVQVYGDFVTESTPASVATETPVKTRTVTGTGKVGIANRKNFSITVTTKKDSFVISAGAKTGLDYNQSDILTVNNLSLQQAIMKGLCTILR